MNVEIQVKRFKEMFGEMKTDPEDVEYPVLNQHIRLLEMIARVENSSITIMDLCQLKYVFIRNRFQNTLAYDEEQAASLGYAYFFSLMHPDDLPMVIDTTVRSVGFLKNIDPGEKKDFKTVFEFRLKDASGQYIRFIQQVATLELDRKGNPWLILILMDLSPNQLDSKTFQRTMINIKNNSIFPFDNGIRHGNYQLSKRELEILGLISQGMMSKEIADRLFISVNTVNNHRQNIIEKMSVENIPEALSYAGKIGII